MHSETCRGGVSAVVNKEFGQFIQRLGNMEFWDAAAGSARKFFPQLGDYCRAVEAFYQA